MRDISQSRDRTPIGVYHAHAFLRRGVPRGLKHTLAKVKVCRDKSLTHEKTRLPAVSMNRVP